MKKIILPVIASLFLASAMCNPESKFLNRGSSPKTLETIASETTLIEEIDGNIAPRNIAGKYPFVEEDEIYSLIDRTMDKKRKKLPKYLDREFFRGVVFIESGDDSRALSPAGARGLMQLTSVSWSQVEDKRKYFESVYNPGKNISVGIKYFIWLDGYCRKKHPKWDSLSNNEKRDILLGSYNGGITRLFDLDWNLSQMPLETRNYVTRVSGKRNAYG